jgi:hypothetical protein
MQKIQKSLCITMKSMNTNSNFNRNFLENYNDSEVVVKTKNAPFFMDFLNISFLYRFFSEWTGPFNLKIRDKFSLILAVRQQARVNLSKFQRITGLSSNFPDANQLDTKKEYPDSGFRLL